MPVPLFVQPIIISDVNISSSNSTFVQSCKRSRSTLFQSALNQRCTSPQRLSVQRRSNTPKMINDTGTTTEADSLGLPPALRKYVNVFASVGDPKLRYQQLLFLAKELPTMDSSLKTDENRVYGCTSVVHVFVSVDNDGHVHLQGDSDSQLTKGLLALLVNGLEGCEPEKVAKIDPKFISYSGLSTSLTPSRNNGFVSMLQKIKEQVEELNKNKKNTEKEQPKNDHDDFVDDPSRPIYSSLRTKLNVLKPVHLDIIDNSAQHAGHAGSKGLDGESHFAVSIVSEAFEGLKMVQRHRLVYTLMNEEMSAGHIHALQIIAKTPSEI